jgi:ribonuclease BN (tRNA processing enzyme)
VVSIGDRRVVLDAGTGIAAFGREHGSAPDARYDIFLSHAHFDHVTGLPYFNPMYRPDSTVAIYGPPNGRFDDIRSTVDAIIRPPYHPVALWEMQSEQMFTNVGEADVVYFLHDQLETVRLRPNHPSHQGLIPDPEDVAFSVHCMRGYNHPKSGVNIYKVQTPEHSIVYATDTEGYVNGDRRLIEFARGADILIHDAMYTEARYVSMPVPTQGYGHSTVEIAASLAKTAGAHQLVLFHHDPVSVDEELDSFGELAKSQFPNSIVGADGLEITL